MKKKEEVTFKGGDKFYAGPSDKEEILLAQVGARRFGVFLVDFSLSSIILLRVE